jgi:hypothetical protein
MRTAFSARPPRRSAPQQDGKKPFRDAQRLKCRADSPARRYPVLGIMRIQHLLLRAFRIPGFIANSSNYDGACRRRASLLMDGPSSSTIIVERNSTNRQNPLAARPQHWLRGSHDLRRRCVPMHRSRPWPIAVEAPALSTCACAFRHHSDSTALMTQRGDCAAPF